MKNIERLQDELIQDGRRLSELADQGKLTMAEWQLAFDSWSKVILLLPEAQRDAMDLEFLYLIQPETS